MNYLQLQSRSPAPLAAGGIPQVWVDADDDNKRIMNGSDISELKNKSAGTLNNFQQATQALQPLYSISGINGKGCIESVNTDADDVLLSTTTLSGSKNILLQLVFKPVALSVLPASTLCYVVFSGGAELLYIVVTVISPGVNKIRSKIYNGSTDVDVISAVNPIVFGDVYLITVIYDIDNNQHILRINGVQQGTTTTSLSGSYSDIKLSLPNADIPPRAMSSLTGAFLYQNIIPSIEVIKMRERYLANRYNINI